LTDSVLAASFLVETLEGDLDFSGESFSGDKALG